MERTISFQCTPTEFKQLLREVIDEALDQRLISKQENTPSDELEVLSSKDVCRLLHISAPTLGKLYREGKIKGKRLNGKILYKKSEVEKTLTPTAR